MPIPSTPRACLRTNRYQIISEESGNTPAALVFDPAIVATEETQGADDADDTDDADASTDRGQQTSVGPQGDDDDDAGADDDEVEAVDEADDDDVEEVADASEEDDEEARVDADDAEDEPAEGADDGPPERLEEIVLRLQASRGKRWSGFTSSNMADLETTVTLVIVENSIQVEYVVNTTGQFLNEDERSFWRREASALEAFVTGGDLVSVVSDESVRATRARRDLLGRGLWFAAIVFVILFIAGIILVRT